MTPFQHKVGDVVRVHFPEEPVVPYAGKIVTGKVDSIQHSEYPYAVTWSHDGRELRRLCQSSWLEPSPRGGVKSGQLSLLGG